MSKKSEKPFQFHIPVELQKSESEDWVIQGLASTGDVDLQGEVVDQNGLDISPLKAGRGLFNADHQKGFENILGQIEDADFVDIDGKKGLMVKGYLFKDQEKAKSLYNIMRNLKKGKGPRVHMSIEGKILDRDVHDPRNIKKARIDKVALTLDPVNPHTFADLVKSLTTPDTEEVPEVVENIEEMITLPVAQVEKLVEQCKKAISAGAGYAKPPAERTGGEAMSTESLDRKKKSVTYGDKRKKRKDMLKSFSEALKQAYPNEDPFELANWVIEAYLDNLSKEGEKDSE